MPGPQGLDGARGLNGLRGKKGEPGEKVIAPHIYATVPILDAI